MSFSLKKIFFVFGLLITGSLVFATPSLVHGQENTTSECRVTSAVFSPYTQPGAVLEQIHTEGGRLVHIIVSTTNCVGKEIYVNLVSVAGTNAFSPVALDVLKNKKLIVPPSGELTISLKSGENACYVLGLGNDCEYHIIAGPVEYTTWNQYTTLPDELLYSKGKQYGYLGYECETRQLEWSPCTDDWVYVSDNGVSNTQNTTSVEDGGSVVDPNSTCYDPATQKLKPDCYELYSGLSQALNSRLDIADTKFDQFNQDSLGGFINAIIAFAIGIGGVLAVVMIMYQGFLYLKTDNPNTLTDVKGRILKTTLGFILLLVIYTGLRTINPDLLNLMPRIDSVNFNTGGDIATIDPGTAGGQVSSFKEYASTQGISCPGTGGSAAIPGIVSSMNEKITYSMEQRGRTCSNNTFCWDCSGFVGAVYSCAGISNPGYTTSSIFSGAQAIVEMTSTSVNGQPLNPGDLLGWTAGSVTNGKTEGYGHVVIYVGNGFAAESTSGNGGRRAGKALQTKPANAYGQRLKYIKRLSGAGGGTGTPTAPPGGSIQDPDLGG